MQRLRKFLAVPRTDQLMLLKAVVVLGAVRLTLRFAKFPVADRLFRISRRHSSTAVALAPEALAWSVATAGRIVPAGGHCLSQAMALQILMARQGMHATIRYGVQQIPGVPLAAHAWLEYQGRLLIGANNLDRFVELAAPGVSSAQESPTHRASGAI